MSRPDEGLIHQWLDGECTPEESARIERLVATDADWAAAVAEARGLIAASSRIIGALDAMPRAMPQGAVAAPRPSRTRGRRMPAWIGVAAGVVLVAGTAYVLREEPGAPFGTVTSPRAEPVAFDTAPGVQVAGDPRAIVPSPELPTIGPASPAPQAAGRSAAAATAADVDPPSAVVPPPTLSAPPPAPTARATDVAAAEQRKEADATAQRAAEMGAELERARAMESRRVMRATEAPRGAVARAAEPAVAGSAPTLRQLDGCWRVSAPPEAAGVLESPFIRRAIGDTLVLVTLRGDVTVTRVGDTLRGGLQATLEPCRRPE